MSSAAAPNSAALADDLILADNGSSAGYATIAWPDVDGESFVLEEKTLQGWTAIYKGPDRATTLSGRKDGTYQFRLKADAAMVGQPLSVTVAHHPLSRAWAFFGSGAVMFIFLLVLLVYGSRRPFPQISPTNSEQ